MSGVAFMEAGVAPAVAELEARAGAPDTDRTKWLAERRGGITATQVRDLYMRKIGRAAYSDQQTLIGQKLGLVEEPELSHVPVIGWGKVREPVIAERLRGEGLAPESRVFKHPDNPRYLASPDGIGISFDEDLLVSEIKTAGYDLPPGSEKFDAKGYLFQVQWVMFVVGANRCRFVVEERIEEPDGSFSPGPEHRYWIERDDALIAELVVVADEFLAELDRQREEGAPMVDPYLDELAVQYLVSLDAEKVGKASKEEAFSAIKACLIESGATVGQESDRANISWSPAAEVLVDAVDEVAAQAAHPKEWASLQRAEKRVEKLREEWAVLAAPHVAKVRRSKKESLRITAAKAKEQEA